MRKLSLAVAKSRFLMSLTTVLIDSNQQLVHVTGRSVEFWMHPGNCLAREKRKSPASLVLSKFPSINRKMYKKRRGANYCSADGLKLVFILLTSQDSRQWIQEVH